MHKLSFRELGPRRTLKLLYDKHSAKIIASLFIIAALLLIAGKTHSVRLGYFMALLAVCAFVDRRARHVINRLTQIFALWHDDVQPPDGRRHVSRIH